MCSLVARAAIAQTYSENVLWAFCQHINCTDGAAPESNLIQAADGNFYGTTMGYGASSGGTVFKITPAGVESDLYHFCAATNYQNCTDGYAPIGPLTQGLDGNFYGTTSEGGNINQCEGGPVPGCGTIFKVTPGGTLTTLYSFGQKTNFTDGAEPDSGVVLGTDGNFYGTTLGGGTTTSGTVFKITPSGTFTSLYSLCTKTNCTDGEFPSGGLVQGTDGNFYGAALGGGGTGAEGVLFKVTPSGTYSVIYVFCNSVGYCPNGSTPNAPLIVGADGEFYGTANSGGGDNYGSIYKVTSTGSATLLYSFSCNATGPMVCDDGEAPLAGLFIASDGNYYGTTTAGGENSNAPAGLIYKYASGAVTPMYVFCNISGCPDGSDPQGAPLQGADGNFYGTTVTGGLLSSDGATNGGGIVYQIAVSPVLAAPVQLSLSQSEIGLGSPVTLSFSVLNAFSETLQQCYAFQTHSGTLTALGRISGSLSAGVYSGSTTLKPTAAGTYNYAVTCGGQESGYATLSVGAAKAASSTALAASPNPATVGQTVTLTATVTGSGATPTGSVTFSVGGTKLATAAMSDGKAMLSAATSSIASGAYPVTAAYSGDVNYNPSTSSSDTVTLNKATTTTTLAASPNPVTPPASSTLKATVARTVGSGFATGTVTFSVDGAAIGSAKLNASGVASFSAGTGSVAAGSYPVVATYAGDSSDKGSASSAVTVVVK